MKNVQKIALQIIANEKHIITDQQLAISCHSLIKKNNGKFLSDKQAWFFKGQINRGDKLTDYSVPKLQSGDAGIIASPVQTSSSTLQSRWVFVIDSIGVREKHTEWWKWHQGKSREQVDKEYENLSERERERNWGVTKRRNAKPLGMEWYKKIMGTIQRLKFNKGGIYVF